MAEDKNTVPEGAEGNPDPKDNQGQEGTQGSETGKKVVPVEVYETVKNDMLKYKQEMRALKEQIEQINQDKQKATEEELKQKEEFKKLYEQKNTELEQIKNQYSQTTILNALRIAALKENIRDVDDIKLIDLSKVKLSETGEVEGVEESIKELKEKKPYLFGTNEGGKPQVPGSVSQDGGTVTKYEDLLANPSLLKEYKTNHAATYEKLRNDYLARTRKTY